MKWTSLSLGAPGLEAYHFPVRIRMIWTSLSLGAPGLETYHFLIGNLNEMDQSEPGSSWARSLAFSY